MTAYRAALAQVWRSSWLRFLVHRLTLLATGCHWRRLAAHPEETQGR